MDETARQVDVEIDHQHLKPGLAEKFLDHYIL